MVVSKYAYFQATVSTYVDKWFIELSVPLRFNKSIS